MFYCERKDSCPYLSNLTERTMDMERIMAIARTEITKLQDKVKFIEEEKQNLAEELNHAIRKPFKPNIKKEEQNKDNKVRRKIGAPVGHRGATRKKPTRIDEYVRVPHKSCIHCGSDSVTTYESYKEHVVSDIQISVKNTCYIMYYGYCNNCKKVLYPRVEGILPDSHIGPKARAIAEYLHYLGISYPKLEKIYNDIFGLEISHPSFIGFDKKTAQNGEAIYNKIKELVHSSGWIHGDETGWRVSGINHWLWNFTNKELAYYRIDKSRGSEVVKDILGKKYDGILVSDFYSAYNCIEAKGKQKCIGHLLDAIKKMEEKKLVASDSLDEMSLLKLKLALKSAIEVKNEFIAKKKTLDELRGFKEIIASALSKFVTYQTENKTIKTLQKRIIKYNNELLTFMEYPEIEPTNNRAERQLRPEVIMRKITFGNRSDIGAKNHSIVMSILQTSILNGKKPLDILLSLTSRPATDISEFINQNIRAP